jgi:hypothetical protein
MVGLSKYERVERHYLTWQIVFGLGMDLAILGAHVMGQNPGYQWIEIRKHFELTKTIRRMNSASSGVTNCREVSLPSTPAS